MNEKVEERDIAVEIKCAECGTAYWLYHNNPRVNDNPFVCITCKKNVDTTIDFCTVCRGSCNGH